MSNNDQFKYIVKERTKSVIIISDSDEEDVSVRAVIPPMPVPKRSNKRKRERTLPGNANDPIALLSDSDEDLGSGDISTSPLISNTDTTGDTQDANNVNAEHTNMDAEMNTNPAAVENAVTDKHVTTLDPVAIGNNCDVDLIPNTNCKIHTQGTGVIPDLNMNGLNYMNTFVQEIKSTFDNVFGGPQIQDQPVKNEIKESDNIIGSTHIIVHTETKDTTIVSTDNVSELSQAMEEDYSSDECFFDMIISTSEVTLSPPMSPLSDPMSQPDMEPPTTVETNIPQNMDLATRLRTIELYLESVSDIETSQNKNEIRVSRRSRDTSSNKKPEHSTSNRPYVPNRVWYNSTWEDWAQLDAGDVLHIPFNEQEVEILKNAVKKQNYKKSKSGRELVDFWQYVSALLPGRSHIDCKCFWSDYMEGNSQLYNKTIVIARRPDKPRNRSLNQMLMKRRRTGIINYNSMGNTLLGNMNRESKISEGSGDAISLAIFKHGGGIRVVSGSLCDEHEQYNMPGNLRLWDSELDHTLILKGHKTQDPRTNATIWRTVTDVKMSKDKSLIYSASHDGSANIWRASTGRLVSTLQYHCKPINQMAVDLSSNDNVLATCSNDGTATIWKIGANGKTGEGFICELNTRFYKNPSVECIEFGHHKTANMLFLGIKNESNEHTGYIEVFDTNTCNPVMKFDSMKGSVCALAISSSGRFVVSGNYNNYDNMSGDKFIHMHDCNSRRIAHKFYSGHPDVNVVAISPCETYVASGNADKEKSEVLVFDVRNNKRPLHKLCHDQTLIDQSLIAPDSSMGIGGLYWTSDSRTIITGGGDSTVKIWGIEGETRLIKTYQTSSCVTSIAVDEESMTVAAGVAGAEGIVHVWRP
ncbi:hypothetical protein INT47_005255 [Mucor saturninus]|uniref:Myb-like domain-containing protein n=1 Tax=Mucor saturninus TaxID=64648 RepID=A0A8H7R4M2_9FUNG|nr:hypothetical protein INT47_005255 [Mucor saturninus]